MCYSNSGHCSYTLQCQRYCSCTAPLLCRLVPFSITRWYSISSDPAGFELFPELSLPQASSGQIPPGCVPSRIRCRAWGEPSSFLESPPVITDRVLSSPARATDVGLPLLEPPLLYSQIPRRGSDLPLVEPPLLCSQIPRYRCVPGCLSAGFVVAQLPSARSAIVALLRLPPGSCSASTPPSRTCRIGPRHGTSSSLHCTTSPSSPPSTAPWLLGRFREGEEGTVVVCGESPRHRLREGEEGAASHWSCLCCRNI